MKDTDIQVGAVYTWGQGAMRNRCYRVIGRNTQYWRVKEAGRATPYNFANARDLGEPTTAQLQRFLIDDFTAKNL